VTNAPRTRATSRDPVQPPEREKHQWERESAVYHHGEGKAQRTNTRLEEMKEGVPLRASATQKSRVGKWSRWRQRTWERSRTWPRIPWQVIQPCLGDRDGPANRDAEVLVNTVAFPDIQ
jgi:hypothetical protein